MARKASKRLGPMTYINYRLDLAYRGTAYYGWQYQPDRPTVQGTLSRVVSELFDEPIRVYGASRTDAGVHALHQVASFRASQKWDPVPLRNALNSRLPRDIRVLRAKRAHPKFVARYGVHHKVYEYAVLLVPTEHPFLADMAWVVTEELDTDSIERAIELLVGTHDFTTFHKPDENSRNKGKVITLEASLSLKGNLLLLQFQAKYFLRYMIRKLVGALLQVGRRQLFLEDLQFLLEARNPALGKWIAPPQGLYLKRIVYDDELEAPLEGIALMSPFELL